MPTKIVVRGTWGQVAHAVLSDGACPAEDFMNALLLDEKGKRYHATLVRLFERLAERAHDIRERFLRSEEP